MWKKDEAGPGQPTAETVRSRAPVTQPTRPVRATIGPSISIRGDVTGSEDLLIQGEVSGSVTLDLHSVAVGSEGRVSANITGRVITIEGEVEGDLTAQEQIVLLGSARVQGDIKAPRVVLEDGATFRGLVDMGAASEAAKAEEPGSAKGAGTGAQAVKTGSGPADQHLVSPGSHRPKGSGNRAATAGVAPGAKDAGGAVDRAGT